MAKGVGRDETSSRTKIAVVGLGAVGGVMAASLAALTRYDVVVCVRSRVERLVVERPDDTIEVSIRALTDPADAEPVDWVFLCTKAHQTAAVSPWLARLCGPQSRVAVLQNGINHADRLASQVGMATIVPTIVYYNGERLAPDRMRLRRARDYDLIVRDDPGGQAFTELLTGTPLSVLRAVEFDTFAWRKLLMNVVANPITALTLQRQAVFRRDDIKALCLAILEEAAAVGRADGALLAPDEAEQVFATLLTFPPEAGTSMLFDRLAGRPFEAEAITGAVVAAGERYRIPTPLNGMLLALLQAVSDASGASSEGGQQTANAFTRGGPSAPPDKSTIA
jgi:2-dehydropantoate 2-reductase